MAVTNNPVLASITVKMVRSEAICRLPLLVGAPPMHTSSQLMIERRGIV